MDVVAFEVVCFLVVINVLVLTRRKPMLAAIRILSSKAVVAMCIVH